MAVVGPVFWKELVETSRRKRYVLLRCLIPGLFLFFVFIVGLESAARNRAQQQPILQQQARAGQEFFIGWMLFTSMTLGMAAPLLAGGLIAAERERGSLELLFTTDLSGREIILGKVVSRVAILWLLVLASAPALGLVGMLGGVGGDKVLAVLLATLSGAAFVASVGLYYSTVTKRTWVAVIRTYFFFALWWMIIPTLIVGGVEILSRIFYGDPRFVLRVVTSQWLVSFHLPVVLVSQIEPIFGRGSNTLSLAATNALISWSLAAAFLFFAHRSLRHAPVIGGHAWYFAPFRLVKRLAHWMLLPSARRAMSLAPSWVRPLRLSPERAEQLLDRQPVAWRNFRASVFDPEGHLVRIQRWLAAVLALIVVFGTLFEGPMPTSTFAAFMVIVMLAVHFLLGVLAAGSISRERERGSLDLLRMTMLTPHHMLFGNMVGAVRAIRIVLWATAAMLAYAVLCDVYTVRFTVAYAAMLAVGTLYIAVQALFVSTAAPSTVTAMAGAVAVGFTWWVAPVCLEDRDPRDPAIGLIAATIPFFVLPIKRLPKVWEWGVAGAAACACFATTVATELGEENHPILAFGAASLSLATGIRWLGAQLVIPRMLAACLCGVMMPLAVGLLPCAVFNVSLRRVDEVLAFPRFVVDVASQSYTGTHVVVRRGADGWSGGPGDWAAPLFFFSTLIATGLLYRLAVRWFPRLTTST